MIFLLGMEDLKMKTWNDYKEYVKGIDENSKKDMEEIEEAAAIITAIIKQRNSLGLTQRDVAALCDMPQSSIGRIETMKTMPNLDTLIRLTKHLGLKVCIVPA